RFLTDPVFHLGQHFARMVDPFVGLTQMVQLESKEARKYPKHDQDWRNMQTSKDRQEQECYLALLHLLLLQGEDFVNSTSATQGHIIGMLSKGQLTAWSVDFKASKNLLSQRLGKIDCGLGFADDMVGKLLCPATCDWHDEEVKRKLRSEPHTFRVGCWPNVFYQNMEMDGQDPWIGFLRNSLLVMVISIHNALDTH
ncbi:hypothetical protein BKA70DRAFT_1126316, partial [Coprinopsis sp. MPI-PUGE-AT-0042]